MIPFLHVLFAALAALSPARCQPAPEAAAAQRIVTFTSATPPAVRVAIAQEAGAKAVRRLDFINAVVIRVPLASAQQTEAGLRRRGEVVRIDEDPYYADWLKAAGWTAEPAFPAVGDVVRPFQAAGRARRTQYEDAEPAPAAQEAPWGVKRVDAPAAWPVARGRGVKVAVIDTGIDPNHPELKANVAGGWNATDKEHPEAFQDDNGHGTHCSGIIAALDDEAGVVGVAPEASLYGVKVLDANGGGNFSDVIAGMEWAVANKMQVASMSLGASRGNEALRAAVAAMRDAGVVLVAAAGNSGGPVGFPAAYPGAIAVAASDASDKVARFSSRGPEVDLIAPGVDVFSTYMGGAYKTMSGTSMACPHVSGLAALAIAAKGLSGYEAVQEALKGAASPLANAPAEQQGAGLPDAAKLVR